ncbi:hypothetical protein [Palleronia abyssalis]|uniref:Holin-X, holin superfamily III n=1 Tax=Palleronia abyssalis TaxID=1501240 RepID=A0A2R8BSI8_9RHOB|nr:hypothetical protein [Palleronia abyssalis]SPJ23100.1 hypothetical protein PAA8504_00905 [Palleronia abyssalis]
MFGPQIAALRFAIKSAARRAKWGAIGALFLLLALVFLGVAVWVALVDAVGVIPAALIIGGVCLVIGLVALAFSRYPPRVVPKEAASEMQNPMNSPALSTAAVVNAVVMGIAAGRAMRRRNR